MNAQLQENIVDIQIPQPSEVAVTDAQRMQVAAVAFHIVDAATAIEMQETRQRINTRIKEITAERVAITKPIDESKARVMAFFQRPLDALQIALKHCDTEIVAHNRRVEEQRREEQRLLELEAKRERERLAAIAEETRRREAAAQAQRDLEARQRREAAEAEQRRIREAAEAEQRAAADRQRELDRQAAEARAAGDAEAARQAEARRREEQAAQDERDRRAEQERLRIQQQAEADQAEADRQAAAAALTTEHKVETFEQRAAMTVAPIVQPESVKVKGVSMRDNWTYEIIDPLKINPAFMTPDTVKIGKLVKALRMEAAEQIGPGVRVFNDPVVASKRAGA